MKAKRTGFTLIELMLVMAIIGLLMVLLMSQMPSITNTIKMHMSYSLLGTLEDAIEAYNRVYGAYPHDLCRMSNDGSHLLNGDTDRLTSPESVDNSSAQGATSLFLCLEGPNGAGWRPSAAYPKVLEFGPLPESPSFVTTIGSDWVPLTAGMKAFADPFGMPVLYYRPYTVRARYIYYGPDGPPPAGLAGPDNNPVFMWYQFPNNEMAWAGESQRGANEGTYPASYYFYQGGRTHNADWHWIVRLTQSKDGYGTCYPYNPTTYLLWMAGADQKFGYWAWSDAYQGYIPDPNPQDDTDGVIGICDDVTNFASTKN